MRIISGKLKGRKIIAKLPSGIRPTQDAMRETIFNILNNYINFDKLTIADVCAGTGMLGIEALSRGAEYAYFVDKNHKAIQYINNSLEYLNILSDNFKLCNLDAMQFIQHINYAQANTNAQAFNKNKIDVLFLDPPYNTDIVNEIITQIKEYNILNKSAIVVAETSIHSALTINDNWKLLTERQFGAAKVSFLIRNNI